MDGCYHQCSGSLLSLCSTLLNTWHPSPGSQDGSWKSHCCLHIAGRKKKEGAVNKTEHLPSESDPLKSFPARWPVDGKCPHSISAQFPEGSMGSKKELSTTASKRQVDPEDFKLGCFSYRPQGGGRRWGWESVDNATWWVLFQRFIHLTNVYWLPTMC